MAEDRTRAADDFLAGTGWAGAERRMLADDASFRRYERVTLDGRRAVLMDAPPAREDVRPFVRVARILHALGLSAPEILAEDVEGGFLLLEDLGDDTFTRVLAAGGGEEALYAQAVEVLTVLHARYRDAGVLPAYDDELLLGEVRLLADWYVPAVRGAELSPESRRSFEQAWRDVLSVARAVPSNLVLRDYHVDNLMWLPDRDGVAAVGLLDFQDAVVGPVTYDLVSLFEDARRDVDPDMTERLVRRYLDRFDAIDEAAFRASYALLGAQRSTKILGIFTRLHRRDGKSQYLRHIPRVWRWLESDLEHPALVAVKTWFDRELPPEMRGAPEAAPA